MLSKKQLAEELNISVPTVDRNMKRGMPFMKLGKSVRFDLEAVVKWYNLEDEYKEFISNKHNNIKNKKSIEELKETMSVMRKVIDESIQVSIDSLPYGINPSAPSVNLLHFEYYFIKDVDLEYNGVSFSVLVNGDKSDFILDMDDFDFTVRVYDKSTHIVFYDKGSSITFMINNTLL